LTASSEPHILSNNGLGEAKIPFEIPIHTPRFRKIVTGGSHTHALSLVGLSCFFVTGVCLARVDPGPTELLVVEIGARDGVAAASWCQDGRRLVQVLTTDAAVVESARAAWDKAGVTGRATIVLVTDFKHLPYATDLIDLVVVEDWSTVDPSEIARVVAPRGRVIVRRGGDTAGKDLSATREADGVWRLPANPGAGASDHYPSIQAGGLQLVADTVAVKGTAPQIEAKLSSCWVQWMDGAHRIGLRNGVTDATGMLTAYGVHAVVGPNAHLLFARGDAFFLDVESPGSLEVRDAFNGLVRWSRPIYSYYGIALAITPRWLLAAIPAGDTMPRTITKKKTEKEKDPLACMDLVAWDLNDGREVSRVRVPGSGKALQILTAGERIVVVRPDGATAYTPDARNPWNETQTMVAANVIAGSLDAGIVVLISGSKTGRFCSDTLRSAPFTVLTAFKTDGARSWTMGVEQLGGKKHFWCGQGLGLALLKRDDEVVALKANTGETAWKMALPPKVGRVRVGVVGDSIAVCEDRIGSEQRKHSP
jgi:hypothetical protein